MEKREKIGVTVIIPVHELNDTTKELLGNAITSVIEQKVQTDELLIVVPKGASFIDTVKGLLPKHKLKMSVIENDGKTDFASQVNFGVSKVTTEWFSVLEMDDEYANIWFKNVETYIAAYPEVSLFLPIVVDVDATQQFIGFTNEAVWANSFSDELGVLDNNALLSYQNFNIDGMVIKKSVYDEFGGFKSNLKLTFIYEFLLRMTFKDVKTMVIPKLGYKHINQREGSLFSNYKKTIDPVEARWWLAQAKKEYYFEKDREITYDTQNA